MHKPSCYQVRARIELERHLYMTAWPNYCIECGGAGGKWYQDDPSPAGVSLPGGSYTEFWPCESCVMDVQCPRCGENVAWIDGGSDFGSEDIEYFECRHCGWTDHDTLIKGIAEHDECECCEIGVKGL